MQLMTNDRITSENEEIKQETLHPGGSLNGHLFLTQNN